MNSNEIRLDISTKLLSAYIERGEILINSSKNIEEYVSFSLQLADELIKKVYKTENTKTLTYLDNAREDVLTLMQIEDDDYLLKTALNMLINKIEHSERGAYLRYLSDQFLNQLLNNLTNIGEDGEKKAIKIRNIIIPKFLVIYK